MKYCNNCKVGIHKDLDNCPLCGRFVEEENSSYFEEYKKNIEPIVKCPSTEITPTKGKLANRVVITILLVVCAIVVALNYLYLPNLIFYHIVFFGSALLYIDVLLPIIKNVKTLHNKIIINIILISMLLVTIDLLQPGGWKGYSINLGFSIIALSAIAITNYMIIVRRKKSKEYFVNMYFVAIYALIPRIVLWAIPHTYSVIPATIAFFFSLVNAAMISVIFFPWIREEFRRKFFLD